MRILITGANGYIGTGVVKALLSLNQDVIATDFSIVDIDTHTKAIAGNIFEIPYNDMGLQGVSSFILPSQNPISCIEPSATIFFTPDSAILERNL